VRILSFCTLLAAAFVSLAAAFWHGTIELAALPALPAVDLRFASSPLAQPFLLSIAFIVPGVALWTLARGARGDGFRLAAFAAAMIAVLLAQSAAAFALAWEAMALISAFLVGTYHEHRAVRRALFSYAFVGQFGAICLFAALALLGAHAANYTFAAIAQAAPSLPEGTRSAVFTLALLAFGSKAGLVPLHFWLPRAHPAAPANASALLSGAMLNVAIYGMLAVALALAAPLSSAWGIAVLAAGLLSSVAGALFASLETDVKRLLAYSSIENSGIAVAALGIAIVAASTGSPAIAGLAIAALVFHAFNHGLFKSLLFLSAGTIAQSAGTTDLERLGGLARALPFSAVPIAIGACAAAALPPSNGFASEWLLFQTLVGALVSGSNVLRAAAGAAAGGLAIAGGLAAVAFVKLYGIGILGRRRSPQAAAPERLDASVFGIGWLAAAAVALGIAPLLALRPIAQLAASLGGAHALDFGALPGLPLALAILPVAGAIAAIAVARVRGVRPVPTWTCGSPVTRRSQYTAAAFSNPLALVFHSVAGTAREWDAARSVAAFVQQFSRRTRVVQGGLLRVYLAYAIVAVVVVLLVAR
jgi:hydrogenase-4 component B